MTRSRSNGDPLPAIPDALLDSVPVERSETIPSSWYTDPAFDRLDRDAVFGRTWQCVAHAGEVEAAGQYITATVGDEPVIAVRGKDGVLRAFYNVCRHRAGPLAMDRAGCVNALTCKYHGWTYLLDGSLRGVPRWDRVELFDRKDYGLLPVGVAGWEGIVFVNLEPEAVPLDGVLAGIAERILPIRLDTKHFAREAVYDVACNWKVYVDNFLEGYHVPYVHPELMQLYEFQAYRTDLAEHWSLQSTPLAAGDTLYSTAEGDRAFYFFVFPNFMLNILPGRVQTNVVLPLGPERCRVVFRYFYDDVTSDRARRLIEEDLTYSDRIQHEDMEICERVHQGLRSRAYDRGRFSADAEAGVHHFQQLLKRAYRATLGRSAPGA